jgi:hypothetical protein
MLQEETKETRPSGWALSAIEDINRRAELAEQLHPEVFGSAQHQARVAAVSQIVRDYFAAYNAIYEVSRPATSRRPAHTEVKVTGYVLRRNRDLKRFRSDLEAAGAQQLKWKANTGSLSVHVW